MRRKKRAPPMSSANESWPSNFTAEPSDYKDYVFAPRQPLDGKNNVVRNVFVAEDGSVNEVIRLNILDDRHREDIVAFHFCMQYARIYYGHEPERPDFYIVGRDDPWDYRYVMHDGSRFNVEICRVASDSFLKLLKAENDCSLLLMKEQLYGYEIRKIEKCFPSTFPGQLVEEVSKPGSKHKVFPNAASYSPSRIFLRPPFEPRVDIKTVLSVALQKKLNKKNSEKNETHLVLDNLTTHATATDFDEAYNAISEFLKSMPFISVWLYTGYYSDDDGGNCEYSLTAIKVSGDLERKLQALYERQQV
jgi:hypothetical protein